MFMTGGWESPYAMLKQEFAAAADEGRIIDPGLREAFAMFHPEYDAWNEGLEEIRRRLDAAPRRPDWPYVEPDDLEAIRAECPATVEAGPLPDDTVLLDRLHGAWTGRAVGCALGQPVEGWLRRHIRDFLTDQGEWELDDYFRSGTHGGWTLSAGHQSCREKIAFMGPDDDIRYTLLGLLVLEQYGRDFRWHDVADAWNDHLTHNMVCTAETQALLNYNLRKPRICASPGAATPAFTRRFNNPYRQWIGAQIRADGWAYCCAGDPGRAAEYAWRDACWTHTANGIYGEMFFAAVIAAAFTEKDPYRLIGIGLGHIPARSQLAGAVREALDWVKVCPTWEDFMARLEARFPDMHWVHTVNNALIVLMGMIYGEMEPERSIAIAVMGGLDTDCNGATVGSIVGAAAGRGGFGKMADRLNDRIQPRFGGIHESTMTELAERCFRLLKS